MTAEDFRGRSSISSSRFSRCSRCVLVNVPVQRLQRWDAELCLGREEQALLAATFPGEARPCMIDENTPHRLGRDREEVCADTQQTAGYGCGKPWTSSFTRKRLGSRGGGTGKNGNAAFVT